MMMQNNKKYRRIFLLLILLLLISISYLALEISVFYEGRWQLVQGQGEFQFSKEQSSFELTLPTKWNYREDEWEILRNGKLFFKPLPVLPKNPNQPDTGVDTGAVMEIPKPTCPWNVVGVLLGNEAKAILVHEKTQESQTVIVGSTMGEFEVIEIKKESVLVKSSEAEFKLELGGL